MNRIDLYKKVIENCDEALKESFINRMNIAEHIAHYKLENNQEINTDDKDEANVQRVTFGVPRDLKPMAVALWRALSRMNRGRQYAYCVKTGKNNYISYDDHISKERSKGCIVCPSDIAPAVSSAFGLEAEGCSSTREVITRLAEGKNNLGAVKTNGFYDTAWLYSAILEKKIFVNSFELMPDGSMLALLSDKIVVSTENTIITVAFSIKMNRPGDLAQKVSILSEAGMNIEFLSVKTQDIETDDQKHINIVFCELSGGDFAARETRAAFMQLEHECSFFRVLGNRKSVL